MRTILRRFGQAPDALDVAAKKWDGTTRSGKRTLDWWNSHRILRHVNGNGFGIRDHDKVAFNRVLADRLSLPDDARGVSIGVGTGVKEINLLKRGVVAHMEMWEISEARVEACRAEIAAAGLSDRAEVRLGDGLAQAAEGRFHLVHWSNALHHMLDMRAAVSWSRRALAPGGAMAFNEYVGPDRFQWPDADVALVDALYQVMPESVAEAARADDRHVPEHIKAPGLQWMIDWDPTESAQSSLILPAIHETFDAVETFALGGAIYHPMLGRFEHFAKDPASRAWVDACLEVDKARSRAGVNYYVAGICRV